MARRPLLLLSLLVTTGVLLSGCAGARSVETGQIPESASLAPADALAYATLTTDQSSEQWQKATSLLERIPGLRDGLTGSVASGLNDRGIDWNADVRPALGPELVVVATADEQPIVLVQPDDESKLEALLDKSDTTYVRGAVDDWQVVAQSQKELDGYRTALASGTLDGVERFTDGFDALPADSVARAWIDTGGLSKDLGRAVGQASAQADLGLDWLAAALSARDDGMLVTLAMRTPGGGDTRYDPELFSRVPADAVAALSFGGTQGLLDRVQGSLPVDEVSKQIQRFTGVPLERLVDSLRGEGALYVRKGAKLPEITLVLAPPDPDKTWGTLDELARSLAEQAKATLTVRTEDGREVRRVALGDVTVSFARLDEKTLIVTTGTGAIRTFASDGPKLVDSEAFERAAEAVDMDPVEPTRGFVYVDVDGIVPLVRAASGGASVPGGVDDALSSLDSFVLEGTGDGDVTQLQGFLRLND
ncbi:MAG TPA: hypothetical protein VHR46_00035 [Gaiella sp.]|nr:hypothetical protein [Gaiella sp.]